MRGRLTPFRKPLPPRGTIERSIATVERVEYLRSETERQAKIQKIIDDANRLAGNANRRKTRSLFH